MQNKYELETAKTLTANHQLEQSIKDSQLVDLYILRDIPADVKSNVYYLINPSGGKWELYFIQDGNHIEITSNVVKASELNSLLSTFNLPVTSMSPDDPQYIKIKSCIVRYKKDLAIKTWNNDLDALLTELKEEKFTEQELAHIVGKIVENICATDSAYDKELLVVMEENKMDEDIASVIEGRFKRNNKNNNKLIVLNAQFVKFLSQAANIEDKLLIKKFSVLHHWGLYDSWRWKSIVDPIVMIISKISTVEKIKIVLRGCMSAASSMSPSIKPKTCSIVSNKKTLEKEPVARNEFLFQQKTKINESDGTETIVTQLKFQGLKYGEVIIKEIPSIPLLPLGVNKLSAEVEKALISVAKEYNLPPLSLPSFKLLSQNLRHTWQEDKRISEEEKQLVQATTANMKTYEVTEFLRGSLAEKLDTELRHKGIKVEIKAYGTAYKEYEQGPAVIKGHDHEDDIKSLVVNKAP